jgi:cytochrome c oxidase subunit IV
MENNQKFKHVIISWIVLITLTVTSTLLTDFIDNRTVYIMSALIIVTVKGQQIVDIFMELDDAPLFWRMLLLSYIVLIPFIITIIYLV